MLLEIAVFDALSALAASKAGADRIELCENASEGGTTASYGTLKYVIENIPTTVFPIIRPRGGDFLYSEAEFEIMKADIKLCKKLGYKGVVLGLLLSNGKVDTIRTKLLVGLALPMQVTFHRAFDRTEDPFEALESIINCGCNRILTSGLFPTVDDGKNLIKQLVQAASNRIIIMPGSGVRSNNISDIIIETGATEIHSSARVFIPSNMGYFNQNMNENAQQISVDSTEIQLLKEAITNLNNY